MTETSEAITHNRCDDFADRVAILCYESFTKLPKKGKPQPGKEWTILAAVVCVTRESNSSEKLQIVSFGTGSRCIGQSKLSANGDLLNDSHAEVLARRGFLRYLYHQLMLAYIHNTSEVLDFDASSKQCKLRPNISFSMFTSHTPCGDGSIIPKELSCTSNYEELQPCSDRQFEIREPSAKQPKLEDSATDIYRTGAKCVQGGLQDSKLPGVEHHVVGVLRTKPGRGDQTLSMSCSDKLAKWNILGVQGSLLMNFLTEPVYFLRLVVGKCPFNQEVMERAIYTRFSSVPQEGCFSQQTPKILCSVHEFPFTKLRDSSQDLKPCPSSVIWTCITPEETEVAVDGRKQGVTKKNLNKPTSRLKVCKKNLFQSFVALICKIPDERIPEHLKTLKDNIQSITYLKAKKSATNYCAMWAELREKVLSTWTQKDDNLLSFTIQD